MDYLSKLENQSIYIMREAFNKFDNLAMLWSIGKDSTVLLWLARKAFLGHVPFPLVHVDTTYKIPSMIEYRDRLCRDWNLQLVVGKNEAVLATWHHLIDQGSMLDGDDVLKGTARPPVVRIVVAV